MILLDMATLRTSKMLREAGYVLLVKEEATYILCARGPGRMLHLDSCTKSLKPRSLRVSVQRRRANSD